MGCDRRATLEHFQNSSSLHLRTRRVSQGVRRERVSHRGRCRGRVAPDTRNWRNTLTGRSPWLMRRVGDADVPRMQELIYPGLTPQ